MERRSPRNQAQHFPLPSTSNCSAVFNRQGWGASVWFFCRPVCSCRGFVGFARYDCRAKKGVAILALREKGWASGFMAKKMSALALVSVVMGSASDWETMQHCVALLDRLGVPNEHRIVSAHRTPDLMGKFAREAAERGVQVIIAGAGGAAHLPGMIAAQTWLPVLGVPVESRALKGLDSLLSIAQMPAGVAVGTLAIGIAGAKNGALLAASIVGLHDVKVRTAVEKFRRRQTKAVLGQNLP